MSYGLDLQLGHWNISLEHSCQNIFWVYLASYHVGTGDCFPLDRQKDSDIFPSSASVSIWSHIFGPHICLCGMVVRQRDYFTLTHWCCIMRWFHTGALVWLLSRDSFVAFKFFDIWYLKLFVDDIHIQFRSFLRWLQQFLFFLAVELRKIYFPLVVIFKKKTLAVVSQLSSLNLGNAFISSTSQYFIFPSLV